MGCCATKEKGNRNQDNGEKIQDPDMERRLNELYLKYDKDGNGGLDRNETRNLLNDMMKRNNQQISDGQLDNFIRQTDKDGDGLIQKNEIFQIYKKVSRK